MQGQQSEIETMTCEARNRPGRSTPARGANASPATSGPALCR